jgi:hypothetical protein
VNLLNGTRDKQKQSGYWITLGSHRATPDQQVLRQLGQKLEMALDELGHIDYQLSGALAKLRCDLSCETHDNLNGQVSQVVEPMVRQAMTVLADELSKAKNLTEEVIANNVSPEKSQ